MINRANRARGKRQEKALVELVYKFDEKSLRKFEKVS